MNNKNQFFLLPFLALLSCYGLAESTVDLQHIQNNSVISMVARTVDDREVFTVKLKDGSDLILVDIDGLAYLDDMILGYTERLKRHGLDIAATDGIGTFSVHNNGVAPSAAIRYPTSAYKWPEGIIPYQIDSSLSNQARQDFLYAVEHWNSNTQVQLKPRTIQPDYIHVINGGGCSSWIGRSGGRQTLTLAPNCGRGAAVHEIGHAVGFFHEQTRTDRDNYIDILWQNIQSNMSYNFQKITRQQGQDHQAYDYHSIMHYRTTAFGIGNRTTISIKDSNVDASRIGNGQQLSNGDLNATAYIYGDNDTKECTTVLLQNGQSLRLNGEAKTEQCFKLQLPDNSKSYQVIAQADNGDADLFVRHNALATQSQFDCKSDGNNSNETCSGDVDGGYLHLNLFAYQAFTDLTLIVNVEIEPIPTDCAVFDLILGQQTNITATAKSSMCFKLSVTEANFEVDFHTEGGTGDADLYVKKDSKATLENFDCKSVQQTSNETCTLTANVGDYYVRVYAWDDIKEIKLTTKLRSTDNNLKTYNGELLTTKQVDIQPNNQWFEYDGGQLKATLQASTPADLELVLQRWNGRDKVWYDLEESSTPTSNEAIDLNVNAGYYRYKIFSWNGESKSDYIFTLQK
ncbi:MAG: hypothetical protein ACI9LM_002512 [Alteromonadaceae bacterium]|jgi:hypothetical protein